MLKAALPVLVALVSDDISMAHFPVADGIAARFFDAAIALLGEATACTAADAAVASCVTETDASSWQLPSSRKPAAQELRIPMSRR
jgi:hypothetical protein